ncbi:MAG: molybdopterin-guanine dinucleotide biosynthesis protein MobB, partial [Proteobacteria bacterium]|nr:molybdopterin-guanine dinucleotide biosynthesis protein MobB [Pseudomonadota bacterium]
KAGADIVVIASTDKIAMIKDNDCESLDGLNKYFNGVDLVIAEGYNKENIPKIEIVRKANGKKPLCLNDNQLIALVTDADIVHKVPIFSLEEIDKLADFIENKYL